MWSTVDLHCYTKMHGTTGTTGWLAFNHSEDACMSYEKGLRNLVVFLFAHYIEAFEIHGALQVHRAILALECLTVADELG